MTPKQNTKLPEKLETDGPWLRSGDWYAAEVFTSDGSDNGPALAAEIALRYNAYEELRRLLGLAMDPENHWHGDECAAKDNKSACDCWIGESLQLLTRLEKEEG